MSFMELTGCYIKGDGTVNKIWPSLSEGHAKEFPEIRTCCHGTFNVKLNNLPQNMPPDEEKYRSLTQGKPYISPRIRVVRINGKDVVAWLYRGGHEGKPIWELLAKEKLKEFLGVQYGDHITLTVEVCEEGSEGMPKPPERAC